MGVLRFTVLDVGQGNGNFVALQDNAGTIVHTMLFDIGSKGGMSYAAKAAAARIVQELNRMSQPTLSAVVLSHRDDDHINCLPDILKAFKPYDPQTSKGPGTLWVQWAGYGGSFDDKSELIEQLEEYMVLESVRSYSASFSSFRGYSSTHPPIPLYHTDAEGGRTSIDLYALMVNAATNLNGIRIKRPRTDKTGVNTDSFITVMEYKGHKGNGFFRRQFVITGDATGISIAKSNEVLTDPVRQRYFHRVLLMTVPHHGSALTLYEMKGVKDITNDTPRQNVDRFAGNIDTETIQASAAMHGVFKHPLIKTLRLLWGHLKQAGQYWADGNLAKRHFYVAHVRQDKFYRRRQGSTKGELWPSAEGFRSVQTSSNVYTSLYYPWGSKAIHYPGRDIAGSTVLPPVPAHEVAVTVPNPPWPEAYSWCYTVDRNNNVTLAPEVTRSVSLFALPLPGEAPRPEQPEPEPVQDSRVGAFTADLNGVRVLSPLPRRMPAFGAQVHGDMLADHSAKPSGRAQGPGGLRRMTVVP